MRKTYLVAGCDPSNSSFSSSSVAGSIQDDNMSDKCGLTQAGLEEYNNHSSYYDQPVFHHQKQSSYAQSEGYHSYVSSSDSSSATPFLDRLRQESDLLSRQSHHWSQNDLSTASSITNLTNVVTTSGSISGSSGIGGGNSGNGNPAKSNIINSSTINSNNIVGENNSSESTSSTETLKWLGSMSDVSETPSSTANISGSISTTSQLIVHSSRVRTPQRQNSESVLYMTEESSVTEEITVTKGYVSKAIIPQLSPNYMKLTPQHNSQLSSSSSSSDSTTTTSNRSPKQQLSPNSNPRSNHRLFPVSTYTEPQSNLSNNQKTQRPQEKLENSIKLSPPTSWNSVAERISSFEKHQQPSPQQNQQQQSQQLQQPQHQHDNHTQYGYTFIDPSKTHRVPNTTLKAFQKNAVQSYFERQQACNILRPHSFQANGTPKEVSQSYLIRNSLPQQQQQQQQHHQQASSDYQHRPTKPQINDDSFAFPDCTNGNNINNSSSCNEIVVGADVGSNSLHSPPPPPPRSRSLMPLRRSSSASDYADFRDNYIREKQMYLINDCGVPPPPPPRGRPSMPITLVRRPSMQRQQSEAVVMGPVIMLDSWVPERPPKNPNLRIPSPDLPPPPPALDSFHCSDDPLPPPPPEIMKASSLSPSRRNSFAGSPNHKSFYRTSSIIENLPPPPVIPKKPTTFEIAQSRPASSMATQSNRAHKVVLNGKLEASSSNFAVRKRPHNDNVIKSLNFTTTVGGSSMANHVNKSSPPPLKPRMIVNGGGQHDIRTASNMRCNSKASYLPRQTCDKINIADPDHGSYKLTLTSNEDSVIHNSNIKGNYNDENNIMQHIIPTKCNNLPDVLPLAVKLHSPATSPTSNSSVQLRYGSNNNISSSNSNNNNNNTYNPPSYHYNHHHNILNRQNSSPTPPTYSATVTPPPNTTYCRSPSLDMPSPKYMSQSTIDLTKPQQTIYESKQETIQIPDSILTPAQSDNSLNRSSTGSNVIFQRTDVSRKLILEERDPGIVRAELVNTVLSASPSPTVKLSSTDDKKPMIRQDSLKENIEKISQLQSKLMSAHVIEKQLGFTAKTIKIETQIASIETVKANRETTKPLERIVTDLDDCGETEEEKSPEEPVTTQKSELTLRLNPLITPTSEMGSQTDSLPDLGLLKIEDDTEIPTRTTLQPRQKLPIEFDCDKLIVDLVNVLPSQDKLYDVLSPKTHKTFEDYVSGLYNLNLSPRQSKRDVGTSTPTNFNGCELNESELQCNGMEIKLLNGSSPSTSPDSCLLVKKKEDLIQLLNRKIQILNIEQQTIAEETLVNDNLGSTIASTVSQKMRSIDSTKFRTFVDDVGHITSLLLSLSGRLARADNVLLNIGNDPCNEKRLLEMKRCRLLEQLEEAKRLKEDIDRRGAIICKNLEEHLSSEEYGDFEYYLNMKAKLIVDSRNIADKVVLTEEQLTALKETFIQSDC
ncbi:SHROOM2 family protein [Megaselia abdita]